jgi:hypothetical protein
MVDYKSHLLETGVVIAGYGDRDYYPGIEEFECYGFLDQHLICSPKGKPTTISSDLPATIRPFATTSMINTFLMGFGPDMFVKVTAATEEELRDFAGKIQQALAPDREIANLDRLVREAVESHRDRWFTQATSGHSGPLAAVIEALPVSDMAALAKSMIELQSLKERVTRPTESVSGPVDVAAISKHDGFVWIERKHYFEPELNPRFFVRQAACGKAQGDSI